MRYRMLAPLAGRHIRLHNQLVYSIIAKSVLGFLYIGLALAGPAFHIFDHPFERILGGGLGLGLLLSIAANAYYLYNLRRSVDFRGFEWGS